MLSQNIIEYIEDTLLMCDPIIKQINTVRYNKIKCSIC